MQRKQRWLPVLLIVAALLLAACPSSSSPAQQAAPEATKAPVATTAPEATKAPTTAITSTAATTSTSAMTSTMPATSTNATTSTAVSTGTMATSVGAPCTVATDGALKGVDPKGQKIAWWHNHSGKREENLKKLLEEFNKSNPCGITVAPLNQGQYNDIRDKVNASISAGEQPAALIVGYQNDQAFYQLNGALADLNAYVDDATWGLTAEQKADFYPSFFNQSVHAAFANQRLGFPPNRSMEVLYYNQTWLEELGYKGPPTTPAEFKEMACKAAKADSR